MNSVKYSLYFGYALTVGDALSSLTPNEESKKTKEKKRKKERKVRVRGETRIERRDRE